MVPFSVFQVFVAPGLGIELKEQARDHTAAEHQLVGARREALTALVRKHPPEARITEARQLCAHRFEIQVFGASDENNTDYIRFLAGN